MRATNNLEHFRRNPFVASAFGSPPSLCFIRSDDGGRFLMVMLDAATDRISGASQPGASDRNACPWSGISPRAGTFKAYD